MISRSVILKNPEGLHARSAGKIAKKVKSFDAIVTITCNSKTAHAHSVLEILLLGAKAHAILDLKATGHQSKQAIDAIITLIENHFQSNDYTQS